MAKKTLTLHLSKPDIEAFEEVLSEEAAGRLANPKTRVVDAPDFGEGARLYVFVGDDRTPPWVRELRGYFDIAGAIETSSAAAVLAFRSEGRLFASTFAHGWMYLDDRKFEGDFGLRVAINALDDGRLKRLERANLGDALRAVALSPFQRDLMSFGLDDALDLIRKISGRTRDDSAADAMTGSRSLRVTGEFTIEDLPTLAAESLQYYESTDYQETEFRIIDFVMPVADRDLDDELDEIAVQSIKDGNADFELGLPIGFDDQAVSYKFAGPRLRGRYADLLLRSYVEALGDRLPDITVETLRDHKVIAVFDEDDRPNIKWSIRSALVGSVVYQEERYAINEGEWYRIEQAFKDSIEETFQGLVEEWDVPPPPFTKYYDAEGNGRYQTEASYNKEFAQANGFVLLDTQLIQIPGIDRSVFEPCDILDIAGKRFIHVKKSSRRSSILSHFFKQGSNSARQFSVFEGAWGALRALVGNVAGQAGAEALDAARADEHRPWKVEFVIADSPRDNGEFNIPFFSKVSLRDELRTLRAMKYDVGLRFIGLQPDV